MESEGIVKHRCVATRTPERDAEARAGVPKWQGSPRRQGCATGDHEEVQGQKLRRQERLGVEHRSHRADGARELDWSGCTGLYSGEAGHESRRAHTHEDFPARDDVQWMKHTLSRLDAKHLEDAKVVLEYRVVIDQPLDDQMHHVPPAKRVY